MRKLLLNLVLIFALIAGLGVPVLAAETVDRIAIQVPECNAVFTLENVSAEYGVILGDVPEYIFAFTGKNGKITCDMEATVELYGEFHGTNPADSNAGGGDPLFEANWSYSYNFPDESGEGITLITVFVLDDGSLSISGGEFVAKITFVMGYPIAYGYGSNTQLPENLINEAAELRPLFALVANDTDTPSAWALDQVNAAIAAELVPSSLQSQYTQATTRAEFCALSVALYENVTGKTLTERMTFTDTTDANVEKMAAIGVVTGIGDNKFDPNAKLTREQAAVMLARLAEIIGKPLTEQAPNFADNSSISSWATEQVGQVQSTGIMSGVGNNTFAPKDPYTREQSIVTMLRLYDVLNEGDVRKEE